MSLTREQLYEEVWAEPTTTIATPTPEELANRCRTTEAVVSK
jgi:hypothetical protein